jgi:hypothetical protein
MSSSMDLEDSLDSLFGSVSNSPTSHLKSNAIADEDKRREARLVQQKQQKQAGDGEEDVDSLLSELRSAKGGSMARTAANVIDKRSPSSSSSSPTSGGGSQSPSSSSTSPVKGGRGARRRDEVTSMAKDAEAFLESSKQQPRDSTDRSRRLGSAAVSWLDSGVSTAKVPSGTSGGGDASSNRSKPSPTADASQDDGTCARGCWDPSVPSFSDSRQRFLRWTMCCMLLLRCSSRRVAATAGPAPSSYL